MFSPIIDLIGCVRNFDMSEKGSSLDCTARTRVAAAGDLFFRRFVDLWILMGIALKLWQFSVTPMYQNSSTVMIAVGILARLMILCGGQQLARYGFIVATAIGIAAIPIIANGVMAPSIGLTTVVTLLAGWMLGRRAMLVLTGFFCACVIVYNLNDSHGWWHPMRATPEVWPTIWISMLVLAAVTIWTLIGNYEAIHDEEAKLRSQLDAVNTVLSEQLVERTQLLAQVQAQRDALERLATHDGLTGLPVMRLAQDRMKSAISRAQRSGAKVALLFVDLDGFKMINDTHGHDAGDALLREVAARMQQSVRASDTVARIGGDEFLVLLDGVTGARIAEMTARKILDNVAKPVVFGDAEVKVGASIGIALYPEDGADPQELRRLADDAMYRVKKAGKNGIAYANAPTVGIVVA